MILSYAVILERVNAALGDAQRLFADDPRLEHAQLVKELRDPVDHLQRLVHGIRQPQTRDEWPAAGDL